MQSKKFKLGNGNSFFDDEDLYKYCASCGTQTSKSANFCILCGSKKFYQTLAEYKLKNDFYCVQCLTKIPKNKKICPNCGSNRCEVAEKAFDVHYKENFLNEKLDDIKEYKKEILESSKELDDILDSNSEIEKKVNSLEKIIEKLKVELASFENDDDINVLEKELKTINNKTVNPKDVKRVENELKDTTLKLENITLMLEELESNTNKLTKEIKNLKITNSSLKEDIKFYEIRINAAKIFKEKKTLKIDLNDQRIYQITKQCSNYGKTGSPKERMNLINEVYSDNDPRTLLLYAHFIRNDQKDFSDIDYVQNTLEGYAKILTNTSEVKGKDNINFDILLFQLYNSLYWDPYIKSVRENRFKYLKYLKNAINAGHKEFEYLYNWEMRNKK